MSWTFNNCRTPNEVVAFLERLSPTQAAQAKVVVRMPLTMPAPIDTINQVFVVFYPKD